MALMDYLARLYGVQPLGLGQGGHMAPLGLGHGTAGPQPLASGPMPGPEAGPRGLLDDPSLRQNAVTQGLLATGAALMEAGGPSPRRVSLGQAIGRGLAAGQRAAHGAKQSALAERFAEIEFAKAQGEMDEAAAQKALIAALSKSPPQAWRGTPEQWALRVQADPKSAVALYDPSELQLKEIRQGSEQVTVPFDPRTGTLGEPVARGPAFAPQQPPQLPADATVYDASRNAFVYASGPLKGQIAKPGPQAPQTSPGDVIAPILAKVARGETLTPGESEAYAMYSRMDPLDRLLMGAAVPGATPQATTSSSEGADVSRATRTATGKDGRKIYLIDGVWVFANGKPVQ